MAKTFSQLVNEAKENIPLITPEDAQKMIEDNPNTLIVDVRDEVISFVADVENIDYFLAHGRDYYIRVIFFRHFSSHPIWKPCVCRWTRAH